MPSDRSRRLLIGVRIEGIGRDTAKDGLCLYWSAGQPPTLPAGLALEWVQGMTRPPQGVSTSVDVWSSRWQISALSLTLSYFHAQVLLTTQTRSAVELTASIAADTLDLPLSDPTLGGSVVWIEDEAILLGAWDGVSVYEACSRGHWGTTAAPHAAGQQVYTRPPYWQQRLVEVYTLDLATGVERLRWRGYLTKRQTGADGTTVELGCEEYFGVWRRAEANRYPRDLNAGGALRVNRAGSLYGELRDADGQRSRVGALSAEAIAAGFPGASVHVAGAIVPLRYDATGAASLDVLVNRRFGQDLDVDAADERVQYRAYTDPAWEVVVWDRYGDVGKAPGERPTSPTFGYDLLPWHPLRIAQILLRSDGEGTADPLSARWGLGLRHIDWTAWDAEIARTRALQIDQVILGADGKPYRPLEVVEELLRALGYYLAPQLSGTLTIRRLVSLTVAGYAEARAQRTTIYPGTLELVPAPDVGLTELTATVGETPFSSARRIRVSAAGTSPRAAYLADARRWEVRLPFWRQSEAVRLGLELAEGASLVHYALPRLRVSVPDPALTSIDCSIGKYITLDAEGLQTAWVLDRDGQPIPPADMPTRVDLVGLVVGVRIRWEDMTHELEVLLIAWHTGAYTRERAPAAEVVSVSFRDLEIEDALDDPLGDDQGFWVGDEVFLCDYTGSPLEGPFTVTSVTPGLIELNAPPSLFAEGLLVLARSVYYANTARYAFEPRPYVYLADGGQILRPAGAIDPPDIYGGGLGVG